MATSVVFFAALRCTLLEGYQMKILETIDLPLKGAKLINYARFADERGYFSEIYRKSDFQDLAARLGLESFDFQQANESRSKKNVVRGLHFQYRPPQGKLIRLLYGQAVDMALDVRVESPSFGKAIMVEMKCDLSYGQWIWLPAGLAHGNFYLSDSAIEYFCTASYSPDGELGISPTDPDLDFSLCSEALVGSYKRVLRNDLILSERDRQGMTLDSWRSDPRAKSVK
ncbi:MAG: dTDP-4-dehydrorhamnose 3,5-epimerase [Deltaproteobacteria bacterium]|nr:dTDP-4-dehydrorhamnose 3,5-epimerase [Deltaproteobacteria bacterium]